MSSGNLRLTLFVAMFLPVLAAGQFTTGGPPPVNAPVGTPAKLLEPLAFRNINPSTFGGRILDIESPSNDPNKLYIATADGGVMLSINGGTTWTPLFDKENAGSIGDIAISHSNPDVIWVGTGENTSTRSAHYGDGVYKSTDGGKTWTNMGLKESKRIGQIVIDPKNPDIVYVASMGYLYKGGGDKGVYKTTDGGKTWEQILKGENEFTGFIDIAMDPKDSRVLFAASHDRLRRAWNIRENGPGAAIYKSTDAGKTWTKLDAGLPKGNDVGRIGLAIHPKNNQFVYAFFDVKGQGGGGQIWRSKDSGKTWAKANDTRLSGGTYYSRIFVDPNNPETLYAPNVNMMRSTDGGKTFTSAIDRAHVDWHTIWFDPRDPKHIYAASDGGLYETRDSFETVHHINNIPIAQFYAMSVDNAVPYNILGGTQDNGSWRGPSQTRNRGGIFNWHWENLLGGDGFYNIANPEDPNIIVGSSQFGGVARVDMRTRTSRSIRPREQGQRANWMAPFIWSPHDANILYWGGNKLHRSLDRGDTWQTISPDLTTNDAEKVRGNVPHCTITTIDVSRRRHGVIWVGTDDGNVWVTENDGVNWTQVNANIPGAPEKYWVARVHASPHDVNTAWVAYTGFREDDWTPYVWKTTDLGKTWTRVEGLPNEQVSVIKQDAINRDLLWVGTETGLLVSFDGGAAWTKVKNGLPTVSMMDLAIQERESDLVIGTHGRGFYVADITPYRQLTKEILEKPAHLFRPTRALAFPFISDMFENFQGHSRYASPNPPYGGAIWYHLKDAPTGDVKFEILDVSGAVVATLNGSKNVGLQKVTWNLRAGNRNAMGEYLVRMTIGTDVQTQVITVESMLRGANGEPITTFHPDVLDPRLAEMMEDKIEMALSMFRLFGISVR
ncbi:MAG TPA: hypothetical protein PLX06_01085 [Fimbriimonadaceae bacterium]|nr:hypothetical protein [Fimbriimonadaceae bacterium]